MDKKIIFFDADGTIVRGNNISELTLEAFRLLKGNGHILVLSTGRALPVIDGVLKELNFDNIICSAGGSVVMNNKIIYSNPMTKESQKELLEYFDKHKVLYNLEANDYIWIKKGNKERYLRLFEVPEEGTVSQEEYEKAIERLTLVSNRTREVEDAMEITVNKLHYYEADLLYDDEKLSLTYDQLEKDLGEKYTCVPLSLVKNFSGGEVCEKGVSKKAGMKVILNNFDVKKENIYAIGDDYNDIDMLEYATTSIAMGHAPEAVKAVSNYITEDIENDGFYHAMKHFGLI